MTAVTGLQKQRQQDQVQTNFDAAQGYSVTPNQGSVVPNVMQTQSILESMLAAKNAGPNITPPSDAEIRRTSWIASGVMGLLGAIVTGNAASGIAVGMSAALALHDHGNDLRQRGEYINELHQKGFSGPAILRWYETGDNKELDKESEQMQRLASEQINHEDRQADREQQKNFHKDQMENARLSREQNAGFHADEVRHEGIMEGIAQQNAESARIAAAAKLGAQDGQQFAQQNTAQGAGKPTLQKTSFDPGAVQVPATITDPQERAAYIHAMGQAYHGEMLKQAVESTSDLKQLGQRMSPQTQMYDKVKEAASKGWNTPANAAGDTQLLMAYQTAEAPNKSPSTTQIKPLMSEMVTGPFDYLENTFNSSTGGGLTDSERATAKSLLKNNTKNQIQAHMDNLKSTIDSQHYDVNDPRTMAGLVNAFHVPPETIRAIASGQETPEQAAEKETSALLPDNVSFGDVGKGGNSKNTGAW